MVISLFVCTAENRRINKSAYLSNKHQLAGSFRNDSSVINPIIRIEKTNPAIQNYNYMYIGDFNRWYYINDIIQIRTNLWEIHAHVDVLYTWGGDIKGNLAVIDRSEQFDNANMYLDDGAFIMDSRKYNYVASFPNGFNDTGSNILICAGGIGNAS